MSSSSLLKCLPAGRLTTVLPTRRRFAAAAMLAPWVLPGLAWGAGSALPPDRGDFPKVTLLNQHGQPVRYYDDLIAGDHTVVINFIYTQCADICPSATANLARVQTLLGDRLGREVRLASISLDPLRDTPVILKAYAELFETRPGWQFLTGRAKDIELIRRQLGAFDRDPVKDRDKSQHTGMLIYGNQARGRWSRVSALADPRRIFDSITRWT
jgi:protein SCO1